MAVVQSFDHLSEEESKSVLLSLGISYHYESARTTEAAKHNLEKKLKLKLPLNIEVAKVSVMQADTSWV